jgi:NitT/TauT family transport system substrate-binding protein
VGRRDAAAAPIAAVGLARGKAMTGRSGLLRRRFVARAAAAFAVGAAFPGLPMPAIAAPRNVKFTLAWLAQGSSTYVYMARAKGMMKARGIDLDISRGFGSVASAQSVAGGQFEFGMVAAPSLALSVAKGLPLVSLGVGDYDSTMGVGVLADSPIRKPQDLAGKKIAGVPTSGEFPFFPAYAKKAGFDVASVEIVNVDAKILERLLIENQVDAIMGFGSSSLPVILSKDVPVRWMLYGSAGIRTYGTTLATSPKTLESNPALCEAMTDAIFEASAYTLTNPDEALELFLREVPEMALNKSSHEFARIGLGIWERNNDFPEPREHGLGWADITAYTDMVDLVMQYLSSPGMTKPDPAALFTNRFVGKQKLTAAQWAQVRDRAAEFAKYVS